MRSLFLVSILGACTNPEEPAECQCVDYKVTSSIGAFDQLTIKWHEDGHDWTETKVYEPTTEARVEYAHPYAGPSSFELIAATGMGLVGVGSAELNYVHVKESYYVASGIVALMP